MSKGIKALLIFTALAFIFTLLYNPDYEKRCLKLLKQEEESEVIGIVVNKYYINPNTYPYLEVKLNSDSSIVKKSFHAEFSGIFDYVEIGDSIYKPFGSLVYTIKRDTVVKEIKFTKFCNE